MPTKWRVAKSLEVLREQLNAAFPKRSKASDGSIGDAAHSSRTSDHNPNYAGVVCARDFTHDPQTGIDCNWLARTLVDNKDPRIKYLIWNKQICSSVQSPWKWRPYNGTNAHRHHLHISVGPTPKMYDSAKKWVLDFPDDESDDIAKVSAPSTSATHESPLVGKTSDSSPGNLTDKADAADSSATETKLTKESGDTKVEVTDKNEQDVNTPAKLTTPDPYLGIGFWAVIKRDMAAAGAGNLSFQGISEYAQQASGWPPWVIGLISKLAVLAVIFTVGWFVFRVIHYAIDTHKKNLQLKLTAEAATSTVRKDIQWQ